MDFIELTINSHLSTHVQMTITYVVALFLVSPLFHSIACVHLCVCVSILPVLAKIIRYLVADSTYEPLYSSEVEWS